ncbi:hypothetical protein SAY86_019370 [Trapa natans]|uniref:Translation elongation factor EF1B beta/delta subunit guanine nucleotide exchange domain-containing protein n=1 Tax=Trapa natans TaxID=22666 RepID=A0AAN7LKX5_TRANT|nr:hypothetical protein SAY86_019370 [Trapa natans]
MLQVLTFEPAMAHVLVHSGFCAADFLYLNEAKHEELMGLSASMEVLGRPLTLVLDQFTYASSPLLSEGSEVIPLLSQSHVVEEMAVTFSHLYAESGLKALEEVPLRKTYITGDRLTKDDIKVYAAVVANPGSDFPSVSKWYECVSSHLAASFPGKAAGVNLGGKLLRLKSPRRGGKKAAKEREAAKKSSSKCSQMEVLLQGASKLAPVGYEIKKLQIILTIVDDLVSVDNLIHFCYFNSHTMLLLLARDQSTTSLYMDTKPRLMGRN